MTFSPEQTKALAAPLHNAYVKERKQAGRQVSYIESWHAESEANRIFGFDGWDSLILDLRLVSERETIIGKGGQYEKPGWAVSYVCTVRVPVWNGERTVMRDGVGAGHGIDADLGQAHESAVKEAASDAEKRALKTFGNQFGLALYDKTKAQVTNERPKPEGVTAGSELLRQQLENSVAQGRKSSAQAKRDGDDVKIKADINTLDAAGLFDWRANFDNYTAQLPASWLDSIRNMLELREEELTGEAAVASEASELDAAFRSTMGDGGSNGVARRDTAHRPAA
jgi:recombination DNA repair RAD52 pathway protein